MGSNQLGSAEIGVHGIHRTQLGTNEYSVS
jgi:hypothetical protein